MPDVDDWRRQARHATELGDDAVPTAIPALSHYLLLLLAFGLALADRYLLLRDERRRRVLASP